MSPSSPFAPPPSPPRRTPLPPLTRARAARLLTDDSGAATAEYAIATMATIDQIRRI